MIPPSSPDKPGTRPAPFAQLTSPTGRTVAALCGITLVFYHGLWLPGLALIKRDAFRLFPQLKQYAVERLSAGELPQWFPYDGMGRSFIGATHTGVFHPFTGLYTLLSGPDAYRMSTLLACLLAAVGSFALGRLLDLSRAGSLLAGLVFTFSGYVVSLTDNFPYLYSICALPLFCAGLERALLGNRVWAIAPAAVWATVFLNGDVQTGYYFGFIALLWMGLRTPASYREAGLRLVLTGGLAALLAGIQLGPAWVVFASSERAQPAEFLTQSLQWSTHPLHLVTVLIGPMGENADPRVMARSLWGTPSGGLWAESLYLGVPVTGLAFLGAWHRGDLRVLAVLGVLALLLSFGKYAGLYALFYHVVPLWSAFRYPEKFMGVVSFVAAMLAGAGLDALRARSRPWSPWLAMAVLCAGVGLSLQSEAAGTWMATAFSVPDALARKASTSAGFAFLWSGIASFGMWVVLAGARKKVLREVAVVTCLVALITLDLARVNLAAYHTGPVEAATLIPPLAEAIRAREGPPAPGRFRIVSIHEEVLVWPRDLLSLLGNYGAGSVERRQALDLEHNAQLHLEAILPYLSGYSSRLAETLNPRTGIEAAARFNVTYYIGRRYHLKDPRFARALVAQLPPYDLALFRNPVPAKPRAYLSPHPETAATPVDPMTLLTRPDFLNGTVDVLETSGEPLPGPARDGTATIERYNPEEVRVRVETPKPAVLILLDAFEQGWTATLENGVALPILRANALVRAVVVPAGAHVVTFSYRTPLLTVGAWASLAGVLLCISLITHICQRRQTGRPTS